MCRCALIRSSAIRRWPSLERSWVGIRGNALDRGCDDDNSNDERQLAPALCLPITLSIRNFVEAGRIKPLARLMTISRKLPPRSRRRGFIGFHISGSTRCRFGFCLAGSSERLPRDGRSAAFIPGAPKLEGPIEGILLAVYAFPGPWARGVDVSSWRD